MLEDVEINISRWDGMHEFYDPGIEKSYEMEDFDEERFLSFADRLIEHYPEPFQEIEQQMNRPRISIATPKPEPMDFQEECVICEETLQNDKIHVEVQEDEGELLFLCRYCFLTLTEDRDISERKHRIETKTENN